MLALQRMPRGASHRCCDTDVLASLPDKAQGTSTALPVRITTTCTMLLVSPRRACPYGIIPDSSGSPTQAHHAVHSISAETRSKAFHMLRFIAATKPGEVSLNAKGRLPVQGRTHEEASHLTDGTTGIYTTAAMLQRRHASLIRPLVQATGALVVCGVPAAGTVLAGTDLDQSLLAAGTGHKPP